MRYQLKIGEADFDVQVEAQAAGVLRVSVNGNPYDVMVKPGGLPASPAAAAAPVVRTAAVIGSPAATPAISRPPTVAGDGTVRAPIPGLIVAIPVKVGDTVLAGQTVAVMEAMKMENNLVAPVNGTVREVLVQKGSEVATGDLILRIA